METALDIRELNEKIEKESAFIDLIVREMDKVIIGQRYMVDRMLIALLSNGHLLLEGVPGLSENISHQKRYPLIALMGRSAGFNSPRTCCQQTL